MCKPTRNIYEYKTQLERLQSRTRKAERRGHGKLSDLSEDDVLIEETLLVVGTLGFSTKLLVAVFEGGSYVMVAPERSCGEDVTTVDFGPRSFIEDVVAFELVERLAKELGLGVWKPLEKYEAGRWPGLHRLDEDISSAESSSMALSDHWATTVDKTAFRRGPVAEENPFVESPRMMLYDEWRNLLPEAIGLRTYGERIKMACDVDRLPRFIDGDKFGNDVEFMAQVLLARRGCELRGEAARCDMQYGIVRAIETVTGRECPRFGPNGVDALARCTHSIYRGCTTVLEMALRFDSVSLLEQYAAMQGYDVVDERPTYDELRGIPTELGFATGNSLFEMALRLGSIRIVDRLDSDNIDAWGFFFNSFAETSSAFEHDMAQPGNRALRRHSTWYLT